MEGNRNTFIPPINSILSYSKSQVFFFFNKLELIYFKDSSKLLDTVLVGDHCSLKCHYLILSCAMPMLASLPQSDTLLLPDFSSADLKLLVTVVYCGGTQ